MPIDPSIALGYRPPQVNIDVPSPLQQFGQVLTLRGMMEQSQARQLQMEQQRLQLADAQRAVRDEQILRQSYADAAGDLDKTQQFVMQRGGSPKTLQDLQAHQLNLRKTMAEINKDELPTLEFRNDQAIGLIRHAQSLKPDEYAQQYPLLAQQWQQINPKEQLPPQMIPQNQLGALLLGHLTQKQAIDWRKAQEESLKTTGETAKDQAEAEKNRLAAQQSQRVLDAQILIPAFERGPQDFQRALAALPSDDRRAPFLGAKSSKEIYQRLLTPEQLQQGQQAAATLAETARYHTGELAARAAEQKLKQLQYDATYGQLIDPTTGKPLEGEAAKQLAMQDPTAAAISNYQIPPPGISRSGPGAVIMRRVLAINPDYDAKNWSLQKDTLLDYGPKGKTGISLSKMGTALGHLGVLWDAAEALKNSNLPALNALANRFGLATGGDAVTTFKTIVHRLGPEIEGAYLAGGGTAGERGTTEADFNPDLGDTQLKNNIATSAGLFRSKMAQTEYQFKQIFKNREMPFLLSPEAQNTMKRITGADIEGNAAAAGKYVRTAKAANGHTIGTNDGKTWYDVQTGKQVQ